MSLRGLDGGFPCTLYSVQYENPIHLDMQQYVQTTRHEMKLSVHRGILNAFTFFVY